MREVLFSKYSMERSPQFAIRTSIVRDGERRWVEKSPMTKDAAAHVEKLASSYGALCRAYEGTRVRPCPVVVENGVAKFEFLEGEFFHEKLKRLIAEKDEEGILALCEKFVSIVRSGTGVEKFRKTPEFVRVFGDVELPDGLMAMPFSNVDWFFENLIEKENGDIALIDYEWCFDFPVPLEYVLYRSFYITFMRWRTPTFVDQTLCPQMGITSELISALWQLEAGFTRYVAQGEYPGAVWHGYISVLQRNYDLQRVQEIEETNVQIFFDTGKGFSESQSITVHHLFHEDFELHIPIDKDVLACRIDPSDEHVIVAIKKCYALSDEGIFDLDIQTNGIPVGNIYMFDTEDPQLWLLDLEKGITEIRLTLNVVRITSDVIENYGRQYYITKENQKLVLQYQEDVQRYQKDVQRYQEMEQELIRQREELRRNLTQRCEGLSQQLMQTEYAYSVISNAFFWKVTKPARVITDTLKSLLKKNRYTWMFCKGLKCWRENGFTYTWRKFQDKLYSRQNYSRAMNSFTAEELKQQKKDIFTKKITFSILVPLYNTPVNFLREMIRSVLDQTYENWELCLADGSDAQHTEVEKICRQYVRKDARIQYKKLKKNLGISENTNACIEMASGDYIALLDHDDLLHPAALHEVMNAVCEQGADFIYTDEATFESPNVNKIITAHFKPDFAIDNLRANNYICHFSVFAKAVLDEAGYFRAVYDGSQDHDMVLRLTEKAKNIVHIPLILYYWRSHPQSVSMDVSSKEYAVNAGKNAVRDSILRHGDEVEVESSRAHPTIYRLKYRLKGAPKVSVIIPNKDHVTDLRRCIDSILSLTTYPNYEILIVDNGSDEPELFDYYDSLKNRPQFTICSLDIEFNYSKLNNFAAQQASGEYYILLNNDIEVITPEWIEEMLMYAQRDDVAAVGAMLYYPDNTIQHAGVILGLGADRVAGHPFHRWGRTAIGYMGRLCYAQNMTAVTAACMMVKASVYQELGGLDEGFTVAYNDVDLCMRIRKAGYLIVWTPYAELYHYESRTRGYEDTPEKQIRFKGEVQRFKDRWKKELDAGDPYYNPNLTLDKGDFSPR